MDRLERPELEDMCLRTADKPSECKGWAFDYNKITKECVFRNELGETRTVVIDATTDQLNDLLSRMALREKALRLARIRSGRGSV